MPESRARVFGIMKDMENIKKLFRGRLSRKNYLLALLMVPIMVIISLFIVLLITAIALSLARDIGLDLGFITILLRSVSLVLIVVLSIIFVLSFHIRRLHDMGKSGWWVILSFFFTPFFIIWVLISGSDKQENNYGPVPSRDAKFIDAIFGKQ